VVHQYQEWLIGLASKLLDTSTSDLGIANVVTLKNGAVAAVQFEVPDTVTTKHGLEIRPSLLIVSSMDGSLATIPKRVVTNMVCHAKDTHVIDGNWRGLVQDHPSSVGPVLKDGYEISVRGIPFPERVSEEHRYWIRERKRALTPNVRSN